MTYYAYYEQRGGGCDYTIACGKEMVELGAATDNEAIAEVCDRLGGEECDTDGDQVMERVTILKAVHTVPFDVVAFYDACRVKQKELEKVAEENREREIFERLLKKFQDTGRVG